MRSLSEPRVRLHSILADGTAVVLEEARGTPSIRARGLIGRTGVIEATEQGWMYKVALDPELPCIAPLFIERKGDRVVRVRPANVKALVEGVPAPTVLAEPTLVQESISAFDDTGPSLISIDLKERYAKAYVSPFKELRKIKTAFE